jgi:hypothetical protein
MGILDNQLIVTLLQHLHRMLKCIMFHCIENKA